MHDDDIEMIVTRTHIHARARTHRPIVAERATIDIPVAVDVTVNNQPTNDDHNNNNSATVPRYKGRGQTYHSLTFFLDLEQLDPDFDMPPLACAAGGFVLQVS